jgi:hypothetical protein
VDARRADFGLFEVDEAALPEAVTRLRPGVVTLGNLFRDQLDRYGELELVAERWRAMVAALPPETTLVVNADDAVVADLADGRAAAIRFGLDDPTHARTRLQHAADSKYCLRCGTPYDYAAAYVGHLGDYRCPNCGMARPPLDLAAREIELQGIDGVAFTLESSAARARATRLAGSLQRLQRTCGRALAPLGVPSTTSSAASSDRRRHSGASNGSRSAWGVLILLIKNPAEQRSAADAARFGRAAHGGGCAERRHCRRTRRLVDLDVDFEPFAAAARGSSPPAAARPMGLRPRTAACRAITSRSCRPRAGARPRPRMTRSAASSSCCRRTRRCRAAPHRRGPSTRELPERAA